MKTMLPKKMLNMNILDILKRYTDTEHRLSQKKILELLQIDYDIRVDRKAIKRNLLNLIDFGYEIEFNESIRKNKNGDDEIVYSDWYLRHDFEDSELRLLIDSLLFSKHIPYNQCKALIEKLKKLSGNYFSARVKHISNLPETMPVNKELFLTIEVLDEAISNETQVSFYYNNYDIDKKPHAKTDRNGNSIIYVFNPFQMVANNGRYYLIGNHDAHDDISTYRIDRISGIKPLAIKRKNKKLIKGMENGLNLPKHMAEHIYMYSGESVVVKFRAKRYIVTEIIDWFGNEVVFSSESKDEVDVTCKVNQNAMFCWALQYGLHIKVLEPQSLVNKVRNAIDEMEEKYKSPI
ncbi:MAG: helix-turn-helix transcriptional regulator [Saccharofermentanales bacterium]